MAVATAAHGGAHLRSISPPPPKIAARIKPNSTPPPLHISTNPNHVNLNHLRDLFAACNRSGHRFPAVDSAGRVEPVDEIKLRTAVSHSSVVVSVFTKPEFVAARGYDDATEAVSFGGDWMRRVAAVTPESGRMVGFGRAVSDLALTASIYDVMVHPALQGRGIGRRIVQRIVRMLTNRDIYDIAALCTSNERLFFKACGFGDDILGSTTMMYTHSASIYSNSNNEQMVSVGRKLLFVPPSKEFTN